VVVQKKLKRNLALSDAIKVLVTQVKLLAKEYNKRVNREHGRWPNLIDRSAFTEVGLYLTHYSLHIVIIKYRAAKDLADQIKSGDVEMFEFAKEVGCEYGCPLPLRFCLPCKH
jgi:hypothetical protein